MREKLVAIDSPRPKRYLRNAPSRTKTMIRELKAAGYTVLTPQGGEFWRYCMNRIRRHYLKEKRAQRA